MNYEIPTTRDDHRIAWFTALAISIHVLESSLPSPLPGVKPGLANIVTLIVLCQYGWRMAAWVSILRVLIGSILIGTFLSPTFILSLAGAVCSVTVLSVARLPLKLGPVGLSVLAAMAHMVGQFYMAYWLFIPHESLFLLLPILLTMALLLGILNGIITMKIMKYLS